MKKFIENFLEKESFYEEAFDLGYENAYSYEMGEDYLEREEIEEKISSLTEAASDLLEDRNLISTSYEEAEKLIRRILHQAYSSGEETGYQDS